MPWDDFRFLLAIARSKGLPGAAKILGVTLSTVFRHLERIERTHGDKIFVKTQNRYHPTETGQELIWAAERMEQEALAVDRKLTGRDQRLTGTLRITASEILSPFFLAPHMADFRAKNPGLEVEIISGDRRLSLTDREADVALWPRRPSEETLLGRKIADIRWAVYANETLASTLQGPAKPSYFSGREFVGLAGNGGAADLMAFQNKTLSETTDHCRSNSLLVNASLAVNQNVFAFLPCILGKKWPGLHCVSEVQTHPIGELWIFCHKDLHRNAKVRALFDFLIAAAVADQSVFAGEKAR